MVLVKMALLFGEFHLNPQIRSLPRIRVSPLSGAISLDVIVIRSELRRIERDENDGGDNDGSRA